MVLNLINFIQVAIVWILIIPDLLFSIHKGKRESGCSKAASITEQFGRYASMLLMVLPLGIWEFGFASPEETVLYFIANGILLLTYIVLYVFFFKKQNLVSAIILAVIRILVFLLCGILLRHWFLIIFAIIFAVGHLPVTIKTFKES
ncbi:MAG: hypothetical protein IKJ82_00485 [Oscillospiraceae bacterium]|nr:hypothetical protein [Clostridia bacterium]MBR3952081.1 hypothetical protein [Oscillospiraceae bacterium]